MGLSIRKANIEDLETVQKLNLQLFEKEHREYDDLLDLHWTFGNSGTKYFKNRILEDDGCAFIAEVDGIVVGYLCGGIRSGESYRILPICAELENTFVLDTYRGKGLGTMLFDAFIERCKHKEVRKIMVEASAANEGAIKFYKKNNFKDYSLKLEADI